MGAKGPAPTPTLDLWEKGPGPQSSRGRGSHRPRLRDEMSTDARTVRGEEPAGRLGDVPGCGAPDPEPHGHRPPPAPVPLPAAAHGLPLRPSVPGLPRPIRGPHECRACKGVWAPLSSRAAQRCGWRLPGPLQRACRWHLQSRCFGKRLRKSYSRGKIARSSIAPELNEGHRFSSWAAFPWT